MNATKRALAVLAVLAGCTAPARAANATSPFQTNLEAFASHVVGKLEVGDVAEFHAPSGGAPGQGLPQIVVTTKGMKPHIGKYYGGLTTVDPVTRRVLTVRLTAESADTLKAVSLSAARGKKAAAPAPAAAAADEARPLRAASVPDGACCNAGYQSHQVKAPAASAPFNQVGYLDSPGCTATMVTKRLALTAAHCVYRDGKFEDPAAVFLHLAKDGPGDAGDRHAVETFYVDPRYVEDETGFAHDFAMVQLKEPTPPEVGHHGVAYDKDQIEVSMLSYPAGNATAAGFLHQQVDVCTAVDDFVGSFHHVCDAEAGSAGGALTMWSLQGRLIVATHVGIDTGGRFNYAAAVSHRAVRSTLRAWVAFVKAQFS